MDRTNWHKALLNGFFVLLIISFTVSNGNAQDAQTPTQLNKISFGTQPFWTPTSITLEAISHDYVLAKRLEKLGFEIEFIPFLNGTAVNEAIKNNQIQMGVGGEMPTISACVQLNTLSVSLINFDFASVIARKEMLMSDLKGKKIATVLGTTAHYAMLRFLDLVDISIDDLTVIHMQVTEMSEALRNKEIDAFVAWEPTPQMAMNHNDKFRKIGRILTTGYMYFDRKFENKNPTIVRELLAAQIRATAWLNSRPENVLKATKWNLETAKKIAGESLIFELTDFLDVVKNSSKATSSLPLISDKDRGPNGRIAMALKFLENHNAVPKGYDWTKVSKCFDNQYLLSVLDKSVTYQLHQYSLNPDLKDFAEKSND